MVVVVPNRMFHLETERHEAEGGGGMSGRENRIRDDEGRNREKDRSKECKGSFELG